MVSKSSFSGAFHEMSSVQSIFCLLPGIAVAPCHKTPSASNSTVFISLKNVFVRSFVKCLATVGFMALLMQLQDMD